VRMQDIASLAGVSMMTVSRVVREPERVAAATRRKVLKVMQSAGYVPNRIAGSLASNRSHVIALVIPIVDPVYADMIRGMTDVLRPQGYEMQLSVSNHSLDVEQHEIEAFLGRRVDGIALVGHTHSKRSIATLRRTGIPVAEIWNLAKRPIGFTVGMSHYNASRAMVRHLVSRGYRRIAYIGGFTQDNDRTGDRERGFLDEMDALKMPVVAHQVVRRGFSFSEGCSGFSELLKLNEGHVDAIFVGSDVIAAGALFEAQRQGLRVPNDIAIAGFDDADIAGAVVPSLTTVKMPRYEIGARVAELFINHARGDTPRRRSYDLGFEIIARESTWRAPAVL